MRATTTSPESELQQFLYAPICQDQEGLTLSVLSAIARQDVDPWNEAARLSQLPMEMAIEQITDLLDGLPRQSRVPLDHGEVAVRLSALLPRNGSLAKHQPMSATAGQAASASSFNRRFFYAYVCLMLLMNWLVAEFGTQRTSSTRPVVTTTVQKTRAATNVVEQSEPAPDR